ncbi:BRO1-domain-containing protein [Aulographum hederae CBS 113979]|uniref:BRO domain-containing protein 1 n=1 Tax=Aulographum hederae CBS 113979 TaxID=1176131 RepID=A0A6G1H3A0_9PEZI|nr:BRO1-domain-containing protein [Aulographum hederae CBS 113979]
MITQAPMLCAPLKQTNEIDWITPLKAYIRDTYGDDPEHYAEECAMLNRLRQDMRGAGKDSAAGRDLLYRYYGQLELLDLRFPVDENHIKISFTWFDAFTHKPTSQYSLAYEKASIIFNISAVLSCHGANQNRSEDTGLKTAYHSFQAAAGMFTYINENFLHAPSTDLSRDTVKCLITLMLAQGQEVFLEKQVVDGKKVGLLAKLASQAAYLYSTAVEGVQDGVNKGVFERVWMLVAQIKSAHMASLAQYYQALADNDANAHGTAIARLLVAEQFANTANRTANAFPATVTPSSNLSSDTGVILSDSTKRHLSSVQEKATEFAKDNDFIYHQPVPSEASLAAIPKLPAAKAIPVSELYAGQDIQRIIGPDIFQRIVPMAVTETASLYDEEKAKLVRAETEKVEGADSELEAGLDYLRLPDSLNVLKGGAAGGDREALSVDSEFNRWCHELAGQDAGFAGKFEKLEKEKATVLNLLENSLRQLDMEASVCEKMRRKYGEDWTQQPSARLTATLRNDARNYRAAVEEAGTSDKTLWASFRQYEADIDEMRSAGETDEAEILYQRAMIKAGVGKSGGSGSPMSAGGTEGNLLDDDFEESSTSVAEQIATVEELMKKLMLVKRERGQVLKDMKEKVHNDDISSVLILNKKSIGNHEQALFASELEKFRPHQTRLLAANHKQSSLLKELTRVYNTLLQDKRIKREQSKYEAFSRQKASVMNKYRRVFKAFGELVEGLGRADSFYGEMRETAESLSKNVETFVANRRSEGGQLLTGIEAQKEVSKGAKVDWERDRLKELMERMTVEGSGTPAPGGYGQRNGTPGVQSFSQPPQSPPINTQFATQQPQYGGVRSPPPSANYPQVPQSTNGSGGSGYNPNNYGSMSPPATQQYFSPPPNQHQHQPYTGYPPAVSSTPQPLQQQPQQQRQRGWSQTQNQQGQFSPPAGWQPPPPPPGPPPVQDFSALSQGSYPSGPGGWAQSRPPQQSQQGQQQQQQQQGGGSDPWAGLSGWK